MPKPSRRERRRMAERGQLPPRRADANVASTPVTVTRARPRGDAAAARPAAVADDELPRLPAKQEYAYVKADLMRIVLLAGTLIAAMLALKFVLPQ